MARWTILLFSLCVVLNGEEIELFTVQRCCQDGRDLALAGQNCTGTSPISSSNTCNITKEQCCSAAVRDTLCDKGIEMAEWQGACETPFFQGERWEIQISKTCCDCCALGLMTASQGSNCDFQGFLMLETCLHTARVCCERSSTAEIKPTENDIELSDVQRCCQDGRDRGLLGQDCTTLSFFFSSSYSCSISKGQCCSATVGEWFCNNGIELAKENGTCQRLFFQREHWETQMAKMCCDCCLLGLMTASQNSSCDLQGFSPGRQCLDTAKACCENNTSVIQPTTNAPLTESPQVSSTTESQEEFDPCRDSTCSQLCKGNGTCGCFAGYELQNDGVNCQEIELFTVQRCCQDGRDLALAGQNCTGTSPISSSNTCNITKEQCCSEAVRDTLCDKGIEMAEWQGACVTPFFQGEPWEIQISKTCCDCCALGLMTASQGSNCDFQGFLMLETCLHTARVCCERSSTAEIKPTENDIELSDVQRCCQDGRDRGLLGQDCTTLSFFFSSSYSCSISKGQCCSATVGEWFCNNGIELAKENGTCQRLFFQREHWETQMAKMCCDCCLLGLMTASQNSSCDLQGFSLGRQCLDTAKACCENNTSVIQPTTNAPVTESPQVSSTTESQEEFDPCRDSTCSQLCKGNGTCGCFAGYELQNDGVNCQDVDECHTGNVCGDHGCVNMAGTYRCECRIGFMVNSFNKQCEDIDECALPAGGHQCSYSCSNVPGSFHCTCPTTGYTLAQNRRTCQDIDECAAGTHTCSFHGSCFNTLGGFRCMSLKCPQYFQLAGQRKDTSASWNCFKVCHLQDLACRHYPIDLIRYISLSLPSVRAISKPKEIAFLQLAPAAKKVFFKILVSDDQSSFDVIKRSHGGMLVGVVRQLKPLRGPKDFVFQVAVTNAAPRVVSHRNIVIIHFFISEFGF